jgi:8-oxo-dGTP pyrophosphatase MutT (NUDIX family)
MEFDRAPTEDVYSVDGIASRLNARQMPKMRLPGGTIAMLREQELGMSAEPPLLRQALAVPYREVAGQIEFCLVTSLAKGRWGFPKGVVDPGDSAEQTAAKESWEEAGLRGEVIGPPLGEYDDAKWGFRLLVAGYILRITDVADQWLEAEQRQRIFLAPAAARERLAKRKQQELFDVAVRRLQIS